MAKKGKKESTGSEKALSSQSLAVKYRPIVPEDVVGQETAVSAFKGMMKTKRIPGGMLITGPVGTGKTTIARMFAAHINMDKKLKTESPSFTLGDKHRDVTVLNAGTNGRIEDIRALIRGSSVAPSTNMRVIIIDECHKLTGASSDALLVRLEEPSPRTVFILCTSEADRVSSALASRCVHFQLQPVDINTIVERLSFICEQEGLKLHKKKDGKKALKLIAQMSDGCVRDAIAHLELLMLAMAAGGDMSAEGALTAYVEKSTVDLDKAAASLVAAVMNMDVKGAVRIIRVTGDPRGLLYKTRTLVDHLIGVVTKTTQFTPYSGRIFAKLKEKHELKLSTTGLLMLLQVLVDSETQFNSVNISEAIVFQANIGNFIIDQKG
jgi:DNA polymerase-3 subunit gamma/tau